MEFNIVDENNQFKIGNIITIFKVPNYNEEFALFSVSDFDGDESSLNVAYLIKGPDGFNYIDEIKDEKVLMVVSEAAKKMIEAIN